MTLVKNMVAGALASIMVFFGAGFFHSGNGTPSPSVAPASKVKSAVDSRNPDTELETKVPPKQIKINPNVQIVVALDGAYEAALEAIHGNADNFFENPRTSSPSLVFSSTSTLEISLESGRAEVETRLISMGDSIKTLGTTSSSDDVASALTEAKLDLGEINLFMDNLSFSINALTSIQSVPTSTLVEWKSGLAKSKNNLNKAVSAVLASELK